MSQQIIELTEETTQQGVSRRNFIKGAIAASAAVSSSNYLFRSNGGAVLAQSPAAGAVERLITLNINGRSPRYIRPANSRERRHPAALLPCRRSRELAGRIYRGLLR